MRSSPALSRTRAGRSSGWRLHSRSFAFRTKCEPGSNGAAIPSAAMQQRHSVGACIVHRIEPLVAPKTLFVWVPVSSRPYDTRRYTTGGEEMNHTALEL